MTETLTLSAPPQERFKEFIWLGTTDEALETWFVKRTWEANIPQKILCDEDSKRTLQDGHNIEEGVWETDPNSRPVRVTRARWQSYDELLSAHPQFDEVGKEPKVQRKIVKPKLYPNASQ